MSPLQGFDDETSMSLLEKYPPGLLAGLQSTSHGAIEDLLVAFPDEKVVLTENLHCFVQSYQVWHHLYEPKKARTLIF